MIDALPDPADLEGRTSAELPEILADVEAANDAYYALSDEEQATVDDSKLGELYEYFANLTDTTDTTEGTPVASIGDETYTALADAVSDANRATSAVTIKLLSSVELDNSVVISNSSATVTLDLNGFSITRGSSTTSWLVGVGSGASLTVIDSSSGGAITSSNYNVGTDDGSTTYGGYGILTNGALTINSGTVSGYYGVSVSGDSASLTVSGGTVSGTNRAVQVTSRGKVTVTGGAVSGGSYGIIAGSNADVHVSGGAVSATTIAVQVGTSSSTATATISGGTVTASTYYAIYNYGTTNISSGAVTAKNDSDGTKAFAVVNYGTLSVTGGTVTGTGLGIFTKDTSACVTIGTEDSTDNSTPVITGGASGEAIYMTNGATTTVYSGTIIDTSDTGSGIVVYGDSTNNTALTVNGGIITGKDFGISTNGSSTAGKCIIKVNGGTITGATGMYLPAVDSNTTITGGKITGDTGIEIRAGDLTVTGGTITGTGDSESTAYNGNGTTTVGAGIAVSQHTTKQKINVTISGGTISGTTGVYEVNHNSSTSDAGKVSIVIQAGTDGEEPVVKGSSGNAVYSYSISSKDDSENTIYTNSITSVSITAGTYNTDVGEYLDNSDDESDTYVLLANSDGTYTAMTETKAKEQAAVYVIYNYTDSNGGEQTYTSYYDSI
ncbi:MAG: hypothetical protein LUC83_08525 [Clostridiales bacterium]|nr:hypothetical protein [Clostridiales bacterium]